MTDEKGVGSLPDAGTIQPGDPGHIETHDEMARLMQVAADSLGIILDPPAPKPAVIGEYGHVDAHNTLLANIEQLAAAGGGGLPGELPGLGGWAEITEVSGSPKRYAYNDGDTDWVAFEWTADGSLTTQAGGLVDAVIVGSGAGSHSVRAQGGVGGASNRGILTLSSTPQAITIGQSEPEGMSRGSSLGDIRTPDINANWWGTDELLPTDYIESNILGFDETFAKPKQYVPRPNRGEGLYGNSGGASQSNGVVIVRVPAAQAAGVDPGSWVTRIDYYAEVTDGTVTDLYQEKFYGDDTVRTENGRYASPEQPDDLIPCDPMVAEGWSYDGKEFAPPPPPPPPTREEIIAELQARMDELTKDKK